MVDVIRLGAVAVTAALCALTVRKGVPEISMVLALAGGAVILTMSMDAFREVRSMLDTLEESAGLSPALVAPVIKTVGIAILVRLASELCRDAGEGGLAAFVETAGAAAALVVILPLLQSVLSAVTGLL
ncbi:MAG: stage III sporulation AC/AD family protein [Intestinimonas sp.]|jgi:stage III sporulation protein AD|nr:stage III sporulation AC/AD family protein [Intestinimonas sp.]